MSQENHKIDAINRTVSEVLKEKKYTVDYFQREYSWQQKHIEQLVTDLTSAFLDNYASTDQRPAVAHYANYYLGPFVVSSKDGVRSIIDGQQRLTSLTLFLIFLNNLQKAVGGKESIEPLIFSEMFGQPSFNIQVDERIPCLTQLFNEGNYERHPDDDPSTINMVERYADIKEAFPEEIKAKELPYFLDWLRHNVILVEITAYSDDNAYTIFESMNDRGLNLTSTEMLKGFILSRFKDAKARDKANQFWRTAIQQLQTYAKEEDQQFFQAWLRSQYADTIRPSRAGSANEDFEKIGTRFHSWFRDNLPKVKVEADSPAAFHHLLHHDLRYYLQAYFDILEAQQEEKPGLEHVFYIKHWGIAPSLALPLMLAPLRSTDSTIITHQKINAVARYIESFVVRRAVNFRSFGASSIRYTMYSLVKDLRDKDLDSLHQLLADKLAKMEEKWSGIKSFRLHGQNRRFVKFLLSRITGFLDQAAGAPTNFSTYFINGTKPFEVEHIWADKFSEHRDEFEQKDDFQHHRNRLGDLVLLPRGTNQAYGAMPYASKVKHYLKENILVKSLHPDTYSKNPNFLAMAQRLGLDFKPYETFGKADINERQALIQRICEVIWQQP